MHTGKLVFAQVMEHLPLTTLFRRCVARHQGEHKVKRFSCFDQYLCMAFAQLTIHDPVILGRERSVSTHCAERNCFGDISIWLYARGAKLFLAR